MTDTNDAKLRTNLEEAAAWRLRLRDNPAIEFSAEYIEWIAAPGNNAALQIIESAWDIVADCGTAPEILEMRLAALSRMRATSRRRWASPRRVMLAAAAAVVVALIPAALRFAHGSGSTYQTGVGERRVVSLPDGSRISLDAGTLLNVKYTANARRLDLLSGRARFDVAHDVSRPFTVTAGSESVVAVGTSFNVERLGNTVLVTLIEGHVVVKRAPAAPVSTSLVKPISLKAGQELVTADVKRPVVQEANIQTETAWEAGRLIFKNEELGEAIERVNRYAQQPVIIDPSLASLRVSGVFNAGDVGAFVSAMTGFYPVEAVTDDDNRIHLVKR